MAGLSLEVLDYSIEKYFFSRQKPNIENIDPDMYTSPFKNNKYKIYYI